MDLLNVIDFIVNVANYEESLTQGDKQDMVNQTALLISELGKRLDEQDKKLDLILNKLGVYNNEENQTPS